MIENKAIDIPAPLKRSDYKVKPEWIDHNGHMNVTFYLEAFDHNIGDFFVHWDLQRSIDAGKVWQHTVVIFIFIISGNYLKGLVLRSPVNWWISTKNVFTCVSLCTMRKKVISRPNQKSFIYMSTR